MAEQRDVVFRRVRGRVIPIRVDKGFKMPKRRRKSVVARRKEEGRARVAFGVATATTGGIVAGGLGLLGLKKASRATDVTRRTFSPGVSGASRGRGARAAMRATQSSKSLIRAAQATKLGVGFLGAGIVAGGLNLLIDPRNKDDFKSEAVSNIASGAAFYATNIALNKILRGKAGKKATQKLLKAISKRKRATGL